MSKNIRLDLPRDYKLITAAMSYLAHQLILIKQESEAPTVTMSDLFEKPAAPDAKDVFKTPARLHVDSVPAAVAVVEPVPAAVVEPVPAAVVEPVPAVVEPVPAVVEPVPAVVEPVKEVIIPIIVDGKEVVKTQDIPPPIIELDGMGLPWDARINTKSKTRRQSDNTWTLKRSLDPLILEQVRTDLRNLMGGETPSTVEVKAVEVVTPALITSTDVFPAALIKVTERLSGAHSVGFKAELDIILARYNVANFGLLMSTPEVIPEIELELDAAWNRITQ